MDQERHLNRVASRVLVAGTAMCGDHVAYYIGMDNLAHDSSSAGWEQSYATQHGLDNTCIIGQVLPGSPAQKAGLQVGDRVLALDGVPYQPGMRAYINFRKKLAEKVRTGAPLNFKLERSGKQFSAVVVPEQRCGFTVVTDAYPGDGAITDGNVIEIEKSMLDFVNTDDELAGVVSHELAHDVLEHSSQKSGAKAAGVLLDVLIPSISTGLFSDSMGNIYTEEFNEQADYLGVYFMERAGYDSSVFPAFLQRVNADNSPMEYYADSHPVTLARLDFLKKAIAEVKKREKEHKKLVASPADAVKAQQAFARGK